jgi:myotubularin-related protein 1/2
MVQLEATKYLTHVRQIVIGANFVANLLGDKAQSCLVHCSDGWDRTSQLTALAQILLDPFPRTCAGLCVVIHKEFVSFGHKFAHRTGHASAHASDEERAPIFLMFLDALFQILRQIPCAFEYTEYFLIELYDQLVSCKHGTFLFNNEKERGEAGVIQTCMIDSHTFICSRDVTFRDLSRITQSDTCVTQTNRHALRAPSYLSKTMKYGSATDS